MARLLCALLLVACTEPVSQGEVTSDQVAAYRTQHRQVEIAATRYDTAITRATPELCISMHRTYDRDVRDNVLQLVSLDIELDTAITAHGGGDAADLACTTAAMTVDLDYHGAVACQETTLEDNQAEAARHLVTLGTLIEHAAARISEISTGLASDDETWTWSLPSRCP